jgi:hypothetical protein
MHKLTTAIQAQFHPGNLTFTRVLSNTLHKLANATRQELEDNWDTIEEELSQANLFMYPALLDAYDGEMIRIYRKDSPLGKVVLAALYPEKEESPDLLRAIKLLQTPNAPKPKQPKQPKVQRVKALPHKIKAPPTNPEQFIETPDATAKQSAHHYTRPLS